MPPVLILSPHCDDIPLSLGASLLAGEWGDEVHGVVIFSNSRYTLTRGWDNAPEEATAVRTSEELAAAQLAGYTVEFLGFPEPGVRPGYAKPNDIFDPALVIESEPVWEVVRASLRAVLAAHRGIVLVPLAVGHHIDHRIVHACFCAAVERMPQITPAFYEDLPYAARFSSEEIRRRVPARVQGRPLGPKLLTRGNLRDKNALLSVYASQLSEHDYGSVAAHWDCRGRAELVWLPEEMAE